MSLRFRKVCFADVHEDTCVYVYTVKLNSPRGFKNLSLHDKSLC